MSLDDELAAIKARVEAAPDVGPYKQLPFFIIESDENFQQSDRSKIMNGLMQYGFEARYDIPRLLAALELCRRQRDEEIKLGVALDKDRERIRAEADAALLEILRGNNENP